MIYLYIKNRVANDTVGGASIKLMRNKTDKWFYFILIIIIKFKD